MKLLMFVEQAYSFGVLEPVANEAVRRGYDVAWYVLPGLRGKENIRTLQTLADARGFQADAVLVPGNWVPRGLGRVAVQVFHGLALEKKGHFRIRGFFDLYCTPGPVVTDHFRAQAARLGYFAVAETGWPKLDPFAPFAQAPYQLHTPIRVLYAPTFSPALTSLPALIDVWERLSRESLIDLRIKFHTLTDAAVIAAYRSRLPETCFIPIEGNVLDCIAWSDVVVSDTSSSVREAQWMGRPVVTFRTSTPELSVLDVSEPANLGAAILSAASDHESWAARGRAGLATVHPYQDGQASARVLDAIRRTITAPPRLQRKPLNLLRRAKVWWRITKLEKDALTQ